MNKRILIYFLLLVLVIGCQKSSQFIDYKNNRIDYMGRINFTDSSGAEIYWSATTIKLNFEGTTVKALLKDENGDNYFNVIVDNGEPTIIRLDTNKSFYTLTNNLEDNEHSVKIYKRTEWNRGKTWFYGFRLENGTKPLPRSPEKKHKIEFYGDSITAGYAAEDTSGNDSPDSIFTNCYVTYAALVARHFDAEYSFIVKSGIGITISWFPTLISDIYNLTDPQDPESKWDFSKFTPDLVIINLFQNDSWLINMPEREEFKANFGTQKPSEKFLIDSYSNFVRAIRDKYPKTKIICMLGNLGITKEGSPWKGYVRKAIANLNDSNIYTFFEPYKNTHGHPNPAEHKVMAEDLIKFIEQTLGW